MANETVQQKEEVKEVRASVRGAHISPRKVRLVTDLVKGMPVERALIELRFLPKKASQIVAKLIESAIANAEHNHEIDPSRLFISHISVDEGQVFMRYMPRAQGRAFPIRKKTSRINLILSVTQSPQAVKAKIEKDKKDKSKDAKEVQSDKKEQSEKYPDKQKGRSMPQAPVQEDTKGKGGVRTYDRRGNM